MCIHIPSHSILVKIHETRFGRKTWIISNMLAPVSSRGPAARCRTLSHVTLCSFFKTQIWNISPTHHCAIQDIAGPLLNLAVQCRTHQMSKHRPAGFIPKPQICRREWQHQIGNFQVSELFDHMNRQYSGWISLNAAIYGCNFTKDSTSLSQVTSWSINCPKYRQLSAHTLAFQPLFHAKTLLLCCKNGSKLDKSTRLSLLARTDWCWWTAQLLWQSTDDKCSHALLISWYYNPVLCGGGFLFRTITGMKWCQKNTWYFANVE